MRRESLNITLSESLRKAQIRQRLDSLADHTALPPTQIAGRALTLGLALIEADLRRLFPGQPVEGNVAPLITSPSSTQNDAAPHLAASPNAAPPIVERPSAATENELPRCEAMYGTDTQRAAKMSPPQPDKVEPGDPLPRFVSTSDAARALGYREESAFRQHAQRHGEIKKLSKKSGRARLWDLPKLRSEYQQRRWQPR